MQIIRNTPGYQLIVSSGLTDAAWLLLLCRGYVATGYLLWTLCCAEGWTASIIAVSWVFIASLALRLRVNL